MLRLHNIQIKYEFVGHSLGGTIYNLATNEEKSFHFTALVERTTTPSNGYSILWKAGPKDTVSYLPSDMAIAVLRKLVEEVDHKEWKAGTPEANERQFLVTLP